MKLGVYYEDIDGELLPIWMLLPFKNEKEYETYSIEAPFERFYPEDFHDSLSVLTVSQGALTRCPFIEHQFDIHIPTVINDMKTIKHKEEIIFDADYFLVRIEDLEELLQLNVRIHFCK